MNTSPRLQGARLLLALMIGLPAAIASDATPAPSSLSPLESALKVFRAAPSVSGNTDNLNASASLLREWDGAQNQLANLEGYFESNDFANAVRQARQYARQARTPEIKKLWEDLVAALTAEQKTREAELNTKLDSSLKAAGARLLAATKSTEVDAVSESLYALQDAMGNNYTPRTQRGRNRLGNAIGFTQQWQDLLSLVESGDTEGARNQLRNLASNSSGDRLLTRSQILARASELKIGAADVSEESAKADAVIKRGAALALTATKPSELDSVIEELALLKDSRGSYDSRLQRVYSRIDNVGNFFGQWQDVLAAVEAGDIDDARSQLRSLATNSYRYRALSRSEILAYAAALKPAGPSLTDEILKDATLDNLSNYRDRLGYLQETAGGRRSSELSVAVTELDRLIAATAALKGSTSSCGAQNAGSLQAALGALKSQWFARALPSLTGLDDLPPVKPGEDILAYVRTQFDDAASAGDWPRAHRLALVEKDMKPDTAPCAVREQTTGANPAGAIGAWLKGRLLEKAAQPAAAAELYRDALKAGAPPKLEAQLIERLRTLATEVPASALAVR
jgi:hypothetical protein